MSDTDPFVSTINQWLEVFRGRATRNFIRYARESGLSMSQLGTLFHLNKMGSSGVTDLGDHLGVTSAAASQLLERLVKQGLIQRTENPNDRRVKQIELTEQGCHVLEEAIWVQQGWLKELAQMLTASEKNQIVQALDLMIAKTTILNQKQDSEE